MEEGKRGNRESRIHPLFSLLCSLLILAGGLYLAPYNGWIFLLAVAAVFLLYGMALGVLKVMPFIIVFGGLYFGLSYALEPSIHNAVAGLSRIAALFLAIVPSFYLYPEDLMRSLNELHFSRSVTLGFLIVLRFFPLLRLETRRIKEAMKTRQMPFSVKRIYRANVVPFVSRLVNLSDALSLSIETKGFKKGREGVTIYKKVGFKWWDFAYLSITIALLIFSIAFLPGVAL